MKKIKITFLFSLLFFSCNLFAQSPGGIENHSVWLKGNFSSDANRLSWLNFNPATALDKSDTRIKLPDNIEPLRRVTVFTVYLDSIINKEKQVWEMKGDFGKLSLSTSQVSSKSGKTNIVFDKNKPSRLIGINPTKSETIIHTYSGVQSAQQIDFRSATEYKESSIVFGNSNTSTSGNGSLQLISEFILYKKLLSEEEMTKIETYLALHYGLTLEKNYLNALGETVWNRDNDNRFSNDIAGIARDDQSTLLQKQSTSCTSPEQLVIGINKIVESNIKNNGQINDGDYLIWGDNAKSFKLNQNAEASANEVILSDKKWLMKASGNSANKISTELKIDTKTLLQGNFPKESFYLVINRSGSENFARENCLYIVADNISQDGIATFSNIFWDTDGSGKDVFTFGFKPDLSPRLPAQSPINNEASSLLSFNVFPNPVTDGNYQVAINLDKPTDVQINFYDLSLQLIHFQTGTGQASYLFSGYINGPAASYIVRLITPKTDLYRIIILQ